MRVALAPTGARRIFLLSIQILANCLGEADFEFDSCLCFCVCYFDPKVLDSEILKFLDCQNSNRAGGWGRACAIVPPSFEEGIFQKLKCHQAYPTMHSNAAELLSAYAQVQRN